MSDLFRIAIDGPGGAGKSTIAKIVARELNMIYVDTGAMYRAIAYKVSRVINCKAAEYSDTTEDGATNKEIEKIVADMTIDVEGDDVYVDGESVGDKIRTPEVSMMASKISKLPFVREKLGNLQREIAGSKNVVMDGRDIGSNIIKDAELKIYLTASADVRAMRRVNQLREQGKEADYRTILEDIEARDYQDMTRALNPLVKTDDAIELDTSNMSIEEVTEFIISKAKERL